MSQLHEEENNPEDEELTVGDCRYFAGLAVHYLNLVVKPNNPKLAHWHFGIERENIADYHHAYVKAVHVYRDADKENVDLFFFDPVALSSKPLGKLGTTDIRRMIDAASKNDHFFYIKRFGEDFVARKYGLGDSRKSTKAKDLESREISFETLLTDQ